MDDSHASPLEPRIIPISPNSPISWEVPEDERMPWQLDPMHFPDPMPRWENELWCEIADMGMSQALAAMRCPSGPGEKFSTTLITRRCFR